MTAAIQTVGVSRRYATSPETTVAAVVDADLTVAPGEFVAIEGPSGSGKTTLLGLLAGIERPDAGSVFVLGHDLGRLTAGEVARLRRSQVGIVFQTFGLVAALSAGENVALPLALDGVSRADRETRAAEALEQVGLAGAYARRVDELSGGERQRVAIARAIVARPAVVLADEPSGSLDEATGRAVLDLLRSTTKRYGASLVLVTHDPESAARADRRYRMRDGHLMPDAGSGSQPLRSPSIAAPARTAGASVAAAVAFESHRSAS